MDDELKALATRAVASPHWWWMPGMRRVGGVVRSPHDDINRTHAQRVTEGLEFPVNADGSVCAVTLRYHVAMQGRPDFTDPATLACVEHLACEALGADYIDIRTPLAPDMSGPRAWWRARSYRGQIMKSGEVRSRHVRAACLVAALEAANG